MREGDCLDQRTTIAVYITNVMTGGTCRHAEELVSAWRKEGKRVIFIKIVSRITKLTIYEPKSEKTIFLYGEDRTADIAKILQYYQTTILHVEHLLDAPQRAFHLHRLAGCHLVVTLHDYYSVCPFIKLVGKDGCYCGEVGCEQELKKRKFYSLTLKKLKLRIWKTCATLALMRLYGINNSNPMHIVSSTCST